MIKYEYLKMTAPDGKKRMTDVEKIPNLITGFRILCSFVLFSFDVFSTAFYIAYILCGISDMIDGTIAKKTNSVSEFGAKFDTIADMVFVAVAGFKVLPAIHVPKWLLLWIVAIGVIKIFNIVCGYIHTKKFISLHTKLNKVTGVLLFILPLTLAYIPLIYSFPAVCSIATVSAIWEGVYIFSVKK